MHSNPKEGDPWAADLLSFSEYGHSFTNLIKSIDDAKVISIEAGFGHGKTFFRTAWAEQLRQSGEIVIEIDALQSDHFGEPIITFLGALLSALPKKQQEVVARLGKQGKKLAGAVSRAALRAVLRSGAEEIIESASDWLTEQAEGQDALEGAIESVEQEMSKLAGQMIASQLAAENARQKEFPEQIVALRDALTAGRDNPRVVILIDELDRCHPEYAISLLEAMKLVFGQPGFVFCLMVNADYLERIAARRFGEGAEGEQYLDKFVDIRLKLAARRESIGKATADLSMALPLAIPFGESAHFSVSSAAKLAGEIAAESGLSMRQIKRVIARVELALRCYRDRPLDLPLLIFLAFADVARTADGKLRFDRKLLSRAALTPDRAADLLRDSDNYASVDGDRKRQYRCETFIRETCPELSGLAEDRYRMAPPPRGDRWLDYYKLLAGLGPRYVPEHQQILDAIHLMMVE